MRAALIGLLLVVATASCSAAPAAASGVDDMPEFNATSVDVSTLERQLEDTNAKLDRVVEALETVTGQLNGVCKLLAEAGSGGPASAWGQRGAYCFTE